MQTVFLCLFTSFLKTSYIERKCEEAGFKKLVAIDTMQHTSQYNLPDIRHGGGRISSAKLRNTIEQCEDFTGLEEGVNRYDLLLLVKRAGKHCGFSSKMIQLLDYYMAYTRDIDWEQGSRPIVYQSLSRTALDMGVSERQIQRLEQSLFEAGAITWNDSGNHRRYGQRCEDSGQILYAFGVDLTPLAYLRAELKAKLEEKQLYDRAWMETKRQISYYRRQIRSMILELEEGALISDKELALLEADYAPISMQIRAHMDLSTLRSLLESHKELHANIIGLFETQVTHNEPKETDKASCTNDTNVTHYKYTTHKKSNKLDHSRDAAQSFQESSSQSSELQKDNLEQADRLNASKESRGFKPAQFETEETLIHKTGLQHVTLKQLLNVSSSRFKDHLPIAARPMNHGDFIEAAYQLKGQLGISQNSWGYACMTLGRIGAAVCVILTDQANLREENRVMKPGAYFNAMISRAKVGELKLQQSVMGHLKREFSNDDEQKLECSQKV